MNDANLNATVIKPCDVAVVMINYNSSRYTLDCIESVVVNTTSKISYCICVVDNASHHDDYEQLVKGLEKLDGKVDILLQRSRINTGFSTGNMLGIQTVAARYYFFLNNDCKLRNDCLSILSAFCDADSNVALCSPQLYNENGKPHPCFDYFPYLSTKLFGLGFLRLSYGKRYIKRKHVYTSPVRVDIVSGSQMFVRASAFDAIGGFDTTFFLYCEEEDIALRFAKRGFTAFLVPDAINTHVGGASTAQSLAIKKEFYISFLYFYRKHFGLLKQYLLRLILALRLLRKGIINHENLQLALFVIRGAHLRYSLRHSQQVTPAVPTPQLHYNKSTL